MIRKNDIMSVDLIIHSISKLVTVKGSNSLRCGSEMSNVEIIENGFLVIKDGIFIEIGSGSYPQAYVDNNTQIIDATGYMVTPGLIDSHTHLVHGGSRENEFEKKLKGATYMEILNQGGGILSTVESTKNTSSKDLYKKAKKSLDIMLCYGVTTIEAKSGYGLDLDTELKQLQVANDLNKNHPIDIKNTFLGAHAIPTEYKNNKVDYIRRVIDMLPVVKEKKLAEYCDVFCEEGVYSIEESNEILSKAKELGFKLKIHADEIVPLGGAKLASELECVSADHLMAAKEEDLELLANKKIVANILPATSFNLNKEYANARKMIDLKCGLAISTDYNPGSCPTENIQLAMQLAALKLRMLPKEIITAVTINAACSVNLEQRKGSIEVGKDADFVIFDVPNLEYLFYHFGINHVKDVYKDGKQVVSNQKICY